MNNDLISRSALLKMLEFKRHYVYGSGSMDDISAVISDVKNAKPVDAVPVRHGRWEHSTIFVICSECSTHWCVREEISLVLTRIGDLKYCPHCGAKMDAEVEG